MQIVPKAPGQDPSSVAALLRHEDAATSTAGALDADSSGFDATVEGMSSSLLAVGMIRGAL